MDRAFRFELELKLSKAIGAFEGVRLTKKILCHIMRDVESVLKEHFKDVEGEVYLPLKNGLFTEIKDID